MFIQQWWPQGRSLGNQDVFYLLGAGTVGGVFLAFRGQTRVRGSYLHWLFLKWLSCKHHRHTKVTYLGVGFPGPHQFLPLKLPWKVHPLKVSWWPGESRVGLVGEWEEACEGRKEHRLEAGWTEMNRGRNVSHSPLNRLPVLGLHQSNGRGSCFIYWMGRAHLSLQ